MFLEWHRFKNLMTIVRSVKWVISFAGVGHTWKDYRLKIVSITGFIISGNSAGNYRSLYFRGNGCIGVMEESGILAEYTLYTTTPGYYLTQGVSGTLFLFFV